MVYNIIIEYGIMTAQGGLLLVDYGLGSVRCGVKTIQYGLYALNYIRTLFFT